MIFGEAEMIIYRFRINTAEKWKHAAGARECLRLFFVVRGELKINIRQKTSRLREGQAIIVAKNDRVSAASSLDNGIELIEIGFDNKISDLLTTGTPLTPEAPDMVKALLGALFSEIPSVKAVEGELFKTALKLVGESSELSDKQREVVEFVEKYVSEHISENIEVDEMAQAYGYNRSHVSRIFSAATGKSIKAYVSEKKVAYAQTLLEFSDFNVNTVAEMMGFGEANHFTKFFSYHTGQTPSDYRRNLRGIEKH